MLSHGGRDVRAHFSKKPELVHDLGIGLPVDKQYEIKQPTLEDVYERTARFNTQKAPFDEKRANLYLQYLREEYPHQMYTRLKAFDEIWIRPDSAVGPLADRIYRETVELLRFHGKRLEQYFIRAIREGWPCWWKTSGKVEMLPKGKVGRTFVFADKFFHLCCLRATEDFNETMKDHRATTMSAMGLSIYGREYIEMANVLDSFPIKIAADVSEWDARFGATKMHAIREFRKECMVDPQGRDWIDKKYDELASVLVFMPSGELLELHNLQPSGQDSTSNDNTMGHTCLAREAIDRTKLIDALFRAYIKLYGDDFIGGVTNERFAAVLRQVYLDDCLVVKEGAFEVSTELRGLTFLGGKFDRCPLHGCWTYVPSKRKIYESLLSTLEELDPVETYNKAFSLYVIAYHTKWRDLFRKAYLNARDLVQTPSKIWTDREIEAFVHGLEGEQCETPLHFHPLTH